MGLGTSVLSAVSGVQSLLGRAIQHEVSGVAYKEVLLGRGASSVDELTMRKTALASGQY